MHNHPDLADREGDEDTDDVQLDEHCEVCLEDEKNCTRSKRQNGDAVRVDETLKKGIGWFGGVYDACEHRAKQREPVEGGVRGEQEYERGGSLYDKEENRVVAEYRGGDLCHQAALWLGRARGPAGEIARVFG